MKLRSKLLALSLLTLLLPWSAWKLLQELERFLRDSQETALLAAARTLANALPLEFQSQLLFAPDLPLPLRRLAHAPILDGYADEWPEPQHGIEFASADGRLEVRLLAAEADRLVQLFIEVADATPVRASPGLAEAGADAVHLSLRTARGMHTWTVSPEAPGPIRMFSSAAPGGEVDGYWLDTAADPAEGTRAGYRLELSLPVAAAGGVDLGIEVEDADSPAGDPARRVGTGSGGRPGQWVALVTQWHDLSRWLADTVPPDSRAWLVDREGWVLADSGAEQRAAMQTTWLQRLLYRMVADDRPQLEDAWSEAPVRLTDESVTSALAGTPRSSWAQDAASAVVRNTVAVPIELQGWVRGALALQSSSDGLLLITNRALGQLLLTTLVLMLGLVAGLWYFATRLSHRVQRLSGAVSRAMEGGISSEELPLIRDRDELGALARNNGKLLRAVADYNQYLQTLAGKLSHELKTPLAMTRSSLDNLDTQALDEESRRYLERAREGLDRQAEIVRAMSEASRLEAAIRVADWAQVDLGELITRCAEGYRAVHPGRRIETDLPKSPLKVRCAPDLLAQALDKLVENAASMCGQKDVIRIGARRVSAHTHLSVTNTGSRLPESLQDRLFDSLVTVRERRSDTPHLGLGLYIVRLVAEAHGGHAEARNLTPAIGGADSREGVEFSIVLPRAP